MKSLRLGTRKSALARAQADWVANKIRSRFPDLQIELVFMTTSGDQLQSVTHPQKGEGGFKGLFTKEIDAALLTGHIDLAVHSFKDLPPALPEGIAIAAIPPREDPRDAWVSKDGTSFANLKQGARVGTSSVRRRAFLLRCRPDVEVVPIRGNVDSRLRKLKEESLDGLVLACAGLRRLGLESCITEALPITTFLPAAGQGALAIVCRTQDLVKISGVLIDLIDVPTQDAAICEYECLRILGGDCQTPIGVHAFWQGKKFIVRGQVLNPAGTNSCQASCERTINQNFNPPTTPLEMARELAQNLKSSGADYMLNGIKTY